MSIIDDAQELEWKIEWKLSKLKPKQKLGLELLARSLVWAGVTYLLFHKDVPASAYDFVFSIGYAILLVIVIVMLPVKFSDL